MAQYIITDGTRFIYRNYASKYVPTSSEAMADLFTKNQAERIYHNSLPKALRSIFRIEKYDNPPQSIKQVNQSDLENNTEKVMELDDIQIWIDNTINMGGIIKEAEKRKEELLKQLHKLEDEKQDIEHYIEFQNLNAAQGYRAYKELKICRMNRRRVKNEIEVVNTILGQNIKKIIDKEIKDKIELLDKRTYKPRIRTDLFDL